MLVENLKWTNKKCQSEHGVSFLPLKGVDKNSFKTGASISYTMSWSQPFPE